MTEPFETRIHWISRCAISFVWLWHGLVPKLIVEDPVESAPLLAAGFDPSTSETIVLLSGIGEMLLGLCVLLFHRHRWPLLVTIAGLSLLLVGVFFTSADLISGAFNPVTLNLSVIALALIDLQVNSSTQTL